MKSRDKLIEELELRIKAMDEHLGTTIRSDVWREAITQLKADAQEITDLHTELDDAYKDKGKLKAENERLRSLAYDDGETHFSWKELAEKLRGELEEEKKYTNKYIKHLHGAETQRDTYRSALEKIREKVEGIVDLDNHQRAERLADILWIVSNLTPQPKKEECQPTKQKECKECGGSGYSPDAEIHCPTCQENKPECEGE